jgi:predicted Zn-dependent peptidase
MLMKKFFLNNGLTLLMEKRKSRTCVILITVKAGSNSESHREKGVSHFLEHILFEGTKTRTSEQISRAIEGIGGDIGAFTANEETCFYVRVLPRHFDAGLEILVDIINNPAFGHREIEKERRVILNEINLKHDEPRFYQWELFLKSLFKGLPPSSPISGTLDSVSRLSRRAIISYYRKHYLPDNMIVTYVGPNPGVELKLRAAFSGLVGKKVSHVSWLQTGDKDVSVALVKPIAQSYLVYGFSTVRRKHKDSYALDVIRSLLGRGLSGSLVNEIRIVNGLSYEVGCHQESGKNYGFFAIYLSTQKENLKKCLGIIDKHICLLKSGQVSKQDLLEAKNYLEGECVMETEDIHKFAVASSIWHYCGLSPDVRDYVSCIRKVNQEDIVAVARKYFRHKCIAILKQK